MSGRVASFIVVLKEDVSEDYFNDVKRALQLYDGVLEVRPYLA